MCDNKGYLRKNDFKTSKFPRTYNRRHVAQDVELARDMSDSEESTKSDAPSEDGGMGDDLSIVAEFDELMRFLKLQRCDEVEDKFIEFVEQVKELNSWFGQSQQECQRLKRELDKKAQDNSDLESKLIAARKMLDQERRKYRQVLEEKDILEDKIARVLEMLFKNNHNAMSDEMRQHLASFTNINLMEDNGNPHLTTIQEVNTTGSLLSDLSYSRSEDDLDTSRFRSGKNWTKGRPSTEHAGEPATKKRRSSNRVVEISPTDTVRATTTLTVAKDGPITATSVIESVASLEPTASMLSPLKQMKKVFKDVRPSAPPEHLLDDLYQVGNPRTISHPIQRQHAFQAKTILIPETCNVCEERIGFRNTAYKCKDCRILCHANCKPHTPLPCAPGVNTPTQKGMGLIGDYTPITSPMVPPLVVHCLREIESRGFKEIGIYRIPGSEKEVKMLKEKFFKGKAVPNLSEIDIHVICGTVKDFLRSLRDPLISHLRWSDFVRAVETKDKEDVGPILYQIISELPRPNQDTLAYMILHLKRVAGSPDCKMPVENLAKVFGPTIVGYSSPDPDPASLFAEVEKQFKVMQALMHLPNDYWESFVNLKKWGKPTPTRTLQQTPSTDSLLGGVTPGGTFTPRRFRKKKQKMFPTPPIYD